MRDKFLEEPNCPRNRNADKLLLPITGPHKSKKVATVLPDATLKFF